MKPGNGLMSGRKGVFYTAFAILVLALLYLILTIPLGFRGLQRPGQNLRVDEQYYFLQSVKDDFKRSNYISSRRALAAASNYMLTASSSLNDSSSGIRELLYNGTIVGNESLLMENSTITGWADKIETIAERSDFNLSLSLTSLTFDQSSSHFYSNLSYHFLIQDPRSQSSFSGNESLETGVSYDELVDALNYLRSNGEYSSAYNFCNFSHHAFVVGSGSQQDYSLDRDWNSGRATILNQSDDLTQVEAEGAKVAIVEEICAFSQPEELADFAGVVAETELSNLSSPCGSLFNLTAFIGGLADAQNKVEEKHLLVLNNQDLWVNNVLDQLDQGCYFAADDAPTFLDRLENNLAPQFPASQGPAHFLDLTQLPSDLQQEKSALDFVYWNQTADYGSDHQLKGVTDYYRWFRLDQDHIDDWGLSDLTY